MGSILLNGELEAASASVYEKKAIYAQLDAFTALVVAGIRNTHPDFHYVQVFTESTARIAQDAEGFCYEPLLADFNATMQVYIATHGETLDGYMRTQPNFMAVPLVKTFLEKDSQPLQVKVTTPIIIYQGIADPTVPKLATDLLISNATTVGTKINTYVTGNWDHGTAMSSNVDNIVADVKTLMPPQ